HWHGRADFLRKVDLPSDLGDWSYEVIDAKLATETRAGTILQLCIYSEIVGRIQGHCTEYMYVVTPRHDSELERYRLDDFSAYHRLIKSKLENVTELTVSGVRGATYPELVPECDICRWWSECDRRRRCDDHLCYVAGINKGQMVELTNRGIDTLQKLADLEEVLRPNRGGLEPLVRVRDQARIQVRGRDTGVSKYELLEPFSSDHGLALLPAPSPGDMLLDLEGDHFAKNGGREYLIGYVTSDPAGSAKYTAIWARDPQQERIAFEGFVDFAIAKWQQDPGMHIYHFAPYEPTALKRLMSRHASREIFDRLLRSERFVDLHTVLKRSVRASVERYSLKDLESFHRFKRTEDLR
ncbi:MAG: TM0106 family RecB-like putative nuclease, partial [Acidimicrobiia bacterium]